MSKIDTFDSHRLCLAACLFLGCALVFVGSVSSFARNASDKALAAGTSENLPKPTAKVLRWEVKLLPVPEGTRTFYPVLRKGRNGISFQACYESDLSLDKAVAFLRYHLWARGWQANTSANKVFRSRDHAVLVFTRPGAHLMVAFFPPKNRTSGIDFRFSMTARVVSSSKGSCT